MSYLPTSSGTSFGQKISFTRSNRSTPKTNRAPKSDAEFNAERKDKDDRLDIILEKISRHGYDHLTKEEKMFLFNQSKK
jgi:hypothetical protein